MVRTSLRFARRLRLPLLALGIAACGASASQPPETTTLSGNAGNGGSASGGSLPPQPDIGSSSDAGDGSASSGADGHGGSGGGSEGGQAGDAGAHADAGPPDPATLWSSPGLPPFDAATVAHVHDLLTRGSDAGKLQTSIAKIGDALTASPTFLVDAGSWACLFGDYDPLGGLTIAASATIYGDSSNAFTRKSAAAVDGWKIADAAASDAIASELSYTKAATALVMLGTNDLATTSVEDFAAALGSLVDAIEAQSVVAVLSTLPPRTDAPSMAPRARTFNEAIRQLASARHLPLVDLFAAVDPLSAHGIAADGVSLAVEQTGGGPVSCDLTDKGLGFGADVRNLLTLQVLDRVWRMY